MKKLFISQPMNGKTDKEILKEREIAIARAKEILEEDVEVIDSYFDTAPNDVTPLWYLGESIKMLSKADIVYFAEGWESARGCKIEYKCAIAYGIQMIAYDSVLIVK